MLAFEVCRSGAAFIACDGLVTRGAPDRGAVRAALPHAPSGGSRGTSSGCQLLWSPRRQKEIAGCSYATAKVICEVVTAANMRMLF